MSLDTLQDLFVEQLKDLHSAESQLIEALPKMEAAASNAKLKAGFKEHLAQTKEHLKRVEQILKQIGEDGSGHECAAMKGLIKEGAEVIKEDGDADVKDAALIAAAQRVEHYEISAYGTTRTFAKHLGMNDAVDLLQTTLDEEAETDEKLTALAEGQAFNKTDGINDKANS